VNYKLKDEKSTGGTVILPGITCSRTLIEDGKMKMKNPPNGNNSRIIHPK
jgi:hypothetical protein